jgi:hypothetical protein
MAKWTRAYVNRLPDSAFLAIEPGGHKDASGRTVPRRLRHFPYMSISGEVDLAHLKDALGRIPQSHVSSHLKHSASCKAQYLLAAHGGYRRRGPSGKLGCPVAERDWAKVFQNPLAKFQDVRRMLLSGLRAAGWTVNEGLKVPHATTRDFAGTRLWFKSQAIYMNDLGSDPRSFKNTHSLSSDMREYKSVEALIRDVERMRRIQHAGW